MGMANVYEPRPEFPCRAVLDSAALPVYLRSVQCELPFAHKGLHRHGWDKQWSETYARYPVFAVGRAGQCPATSGNYQCRFDAGHDPEADFGDMIHQAHGTRWSDPHTDDEWEAHETVLALAFLGQTEGTE